MKDFTKLAAYLRGNGGLSRMAGRQVGRAQGGTLLCTAAAQRFITSQGHRFAAS